MKFFSSLLFVAVLFGPGFSTEPPGVEFPTFPSPPPQIEVNPAKPVELGVDQFYVIASVKPLVLLADGPGGVTVAARKPPFMLPAKQAIGWKAAAGDPEFVIWDTKTPFLYVVKAAKPGDVLITVIPAINAVTADKQQIPLTAKDVQRRQLAITTVPVPPTPVDPPKPIDPPKPVDPPIPNPAKGFRVMIVYETDANLTREQLNVLNSSTIMAYLNTHCVKDANGMAEWRKWDKPTIDRPGALQKESQVWQQLWNDSKSRLGKLPQIVIVNDQAGAAFEIPTNATEADTLTLLKKYGG